MGQQQQQPQHPPPLQEEDGEEPPLPEASVTQPPQVKDVLKELPEEAPSEEVKKIEPAVASIPVVAASKTVVAEAVALPAELSDQNSPQISRQMAEETSNHKTTTKTENCIEENNTKTETISNEIVVDATKKEIIVEKTNTTTTKIEEKMSNLNTNSTAAEMEIEDRPQPPEDDTVPDDVD